MMVNRFQLSELALKSLETRGFHLICHYCGAPLKAGEMILSRPILLRSKRNERQYWHAECWDVECRSL